MVLKKKKSSKFSRLEKGLSPSYLSGFKSITLGEETAKGRILGGAYPPGAVQWTGTAGLVLFTERARGQSSEKGEGKRRPVPGAPPLPMIPGRPCTLSPRRLGLWLLRGPAGRAGGRDAAAAGVHLRQGPGGWLGLAEAGSWVPSTSGRGTLRPQPPLEPPGLRRPPEPTSQFRVRGPVGGHLLHDAAAGAGLSRGAGRRLRRGAAGHWDFQPAWGEVRSAGFGDTCRAAWRPQCIQNSWRGAFTHPEWSWQSGSSLKVPFGGREAGRFASGNPKGSARVSPIGKERGGLGTETSPFPGLAGMVAVGTSGLQKQGTLNLRTEAGCLSPKPLDTT